mmetsp:Transcript_64373/g.178926  ORF Transcript_64373/g.178926 Transcript_64373/m.178926 type:complete len:215 (+) Transcript_64373:34-678(+)
MAFQRSYSRLQSSPHWRRLETFAADNVRLELQFGTEVTSTAREDIRQICKYLNLNFRCIGQGMHKRIVALKLDALRERARAEELVKSAPDVVGSFHRAVLELLPESEHIRATALFVKHYGGEKAWSLGESDDRPEAADGSRKRPHAEVDGRGSASASKRPGGAQADSVAADRDDAAAAAENDSDEDDDVEALLGRWVSVPGREGASASGTAGQR